MSLPTRSDGTIDWVEATRLARLNPPAPSPQQLIAELRLLNAAELQRISAMGADAPRVLAAEREQSATNYRREQERLGVERTAAQTQRLKDALEARKQEQASGGSPNLERLEKAKADYEKACAAIRAQAAAPIVMTNDEMLAAHARKASIAERYNSARAESLRDKSLATEKF
jgi:hypothetical protein